MEDNKTIIVKIRALIADIQRKESLVSKQEEDKMWSRINDSISNYNPVIPTRKSNRLIIKWGQIAAAVIITFACSYFLFKSDPQVVEEKINMQTLHIPAGQRAELTLSDGTQVWLNSLTTFIFPDKFNANSREVFLDGEAYFDVKHNPESVFRVNAGKYSVRVLGTEFNLVAYNKGLEFETSLLEGSVEIVSADLLQPVKLTPGNRVYLKNDSLIVDAIQYDDYFLWKKGIISFHQETLGNIFERLQKYYDITIINKNERIKDLRYFGKFRAKDGIDQVMQALQIATGIRYQKDTEENIIYIY